MIQLLKENKKVRTFAFGFMLHLICISLFIYSKLNNEIFFWEMTSIFLLVVLCAIFAHNVINLYAEEEELEDKIIKDQDFGKIILPVWFTAAITIILVMLMLFFNHETMAAIIIVNLGVRVLLHRETNRVRAKIEEGIY